MNIKVNCQDLKDVDGRKNYKQKDTCNRLQVFIGA